MLTQIKNARFYLQAKLGQRGAEMVEYAIVLACIAAVAAVVYTADGTADGTLKGVLDKLWKKVDTNAQAVTAAPAASGSGSQNVGQ